MNLLGVIAQCFGIFALITTVSSFHFKEYRQIVFLQLLSSVFFTIHFLLMYFSGQTDALTAGVLNAISLTRNVVLRYTADRRTEKGTAWIAGVFSVIVIIAGLITWKSPISLLFIIAMVFITIAMSIKNPNTLRLLMVIAMPFSFTYDLCIGSIGGSINEAISFFSALIAYLRNRPSKS